MQLLFESSDEGDGEGEGEGLGLFPGRVRRLQARRVPHMGWNRVEWTLAAPEAPQVAYFAHGFAVPADTPGAIATAVHEGASFAAAVASARTLGVQFHPEKSGPEGVRWLAAQVRALASGGVSSWT
jgi:glutamine amidotransferase